MSRRDRRAARKYHSRRINKKNRRFAQIAIVLVFVMLATAFLANGYREQAAQRSLVSEETQNGDGAQEQPDAGLAAPEQPVAPDADLPPYMEIDGNVPFFEEADLVKEPFIIYAPLDSLGRCGAAYAKLSGDGMPADKTREPMTQIHPSGWHTVKYPELISDNYLYNRCHLIAYALTGDGADERNLITGTRYLNVTGMLPFEEQVMRYLEKTENHVMYRVTPVYSGEELVARAVQMEAYSVEDNGEGVCYNVYIPNVQPGIEIDYATGESHEQTE